MGTIAIPAQNQAKPVDIVVRGAAGDIGSNLLKYLAHAIAMADSSDVVPQIRLWGIIRDLKNLDGYAGSLAYRTNRGLQYEDAYILYGLDGHDGPSEVFLEKDGIVSAPIKLITKVEEIPNPGRIHFVECTETSDYSKLEKLAKDMNADRLLFSAPISNIPKGVNVPTKAAHINTDRLEDAKVISGASCTTNGAAAMLMPLMEQLPVKKWVCGDLTTLHEPTGTQSVLDTTKADAKKKQTIGTFFDTTTGAAKALKQVFPDYFDFFDKSFTAKAVRVPCDGSQIDLELIVEAKPGYPITKELVENCYAQLLPYQNRLLNRIRLSNGRVSLREGFDALIDKKKQQNREVYLTERPDVNSRQILNTEVTAVIKKDSIKVDKLPTGDHLYRIKLSGLYDNVRGYAAQFADLNIMYLNQFMGTKIPFVERTNFWNLIYDPANPNSLNKAGISTLNAYLAQHDIQGKTVGMRLELNVTWGEKDGKLIIKDPKRIDEALPEIKAVIKAGGRPVIMYHVEDKNKVKGIEYKDNQLIFDYIDRKLKESFGEKVKLDYVREPQFFGSEAAAKLQDLKKGSTQVLLLQNVRMNPQDRQKEKENVIDLVVPLVNEIDLYVDCGTGLMHRNAATNLGIKHLMKQEGKPVIAGELFVKELNVLQSLLNSFKQMPYKSVAVFAGSKIGNSYNQRGELVDEGKIGILNAFIDLGVKHIIIGGKMTNAFLAAKGISTGFVEIDPKERALAEEVIKKCDAKQIQLILPRDFVTVSSNDLAKVFPSSEDKNLKTGNGIQKQSGEIRTHIERTISPHRVQLDVGPETIKLWQEILHSNPYRVWNGPVGVFENPLFAKGTDAIAKIFADSKDGLSVIGGGDTNAAVKKLIPKNTSNCRLLNGGGAPMAYLSSGGNLPTIIALKESVPGRNIWQ